MVLFSRVVALGVFKFGEKGFGTGPLVLGEGPDSWHPRQNTSPVKTPSAVQNSSLKSMQYFLIVCNV